jgi:hypothetical protein
MPLAIAQRALFAVVNSNGPGSRLDDANAGGASTIARVQNPNRMRPISRPIVAATAIPAAHWHTFN